MMGGWILTLRGAGWAQQQGPNYKEEWSTWYGDIPYGDDPKDRWWILQGMKFYVDNY